MVRPLVPSRSASGLALASLAVAPLLLVAAIAANQIGEALVTSGQVDRAAFGWFVVVPLVLLSPGAAALTWQTTARRQLAGRLIACMSLAIGLAVEVLLAVSVTQIGCTPVRDPLQVLAPAFPTALAAGAAFGLAGAAGIVSVGVGGRDRVVAIRTVAAGAIGLALFGMAAILVFTATFGGVTCAIPQ
jgi:hypothetical protein